MSPNQFKPNEIKNAKLVQRKLLFISYSIAGIGMIASAQFKVTYCSISECKFTWPHCLYP